MTAGPAPVDRWESAAWASATAAATVAVATHNRSAFLPELVAALQRQDDVSIEVVVVDDGSTDDTAAVLADLATRTTLPFLALRIQASGGPSTPRNVAAAHGRAPLLLFTDDDCLPTPPWAAALVRELRQGATVVQGRTTPAGTAPGPWHRSIWVEKPGPLFETCNIGYQRASFEAAGGFPVLELLRSGAARGFGEDAVLGGEVAAAGRHGWAPDALVHHRWLPGTFRDHLAGRARLVGFPALVRAAPPVGDALVGGVFLSRRTLQFDAAVVSLAAAMLSRRLWPAAGAVPWVAATVDAARRKPGRSPVVRAAQLACADAVGLGALVRGSLRFRRLVV